MSSVEDSTTPATGTALPVSGRAFDAVVSVFSLLLVAGIAMDFRAHANGISFAEEGFLTPEHVFFYSAFLAVAGTLAAGTYARRRAGADWIDAVPAGYGVAVVGVLVFGLGGFGDFLWHSAFGFEESFEALVSPSHLTLGVGAVLFLSAPMRAASARNERDGALASVPVVVSLTLVLAIIGMFGGFVNPLVRPYPSVDYYVMQETTTMLVAWPLLYLGAVVVAIRRFDVVPGAFTLAFGASALAIAQAEGHLALVVPAVVAGVVADLFAQYWPPRPSSARPTRAFCAVLPAAFSAAYFATVELRWGIDHSHIYEEMYNWSIHVVGGAIVLPALAGLLFSLVVADGGGGDGGESAVSERAESERGTADAVEREVA